MNEDPVNVLHVLLENFPVQDLVSANRALLENSLPNMEQQNALSALLDRSPMRLVQLNALSVISEPFLWKVQVAAHHVMLDSIRT